MAAVAAFGGYGDLRIGSAGLRRAIDRPGLGAASALLPSPTALPRQAPLLARRTPAPPGLARAWDQLGLPNCMGAEKALWIF